MQGDEQLLQQNPEAMAMITAGVPREEVIAGLRARAATGSVTTVNNIPPPPRPPPADEEEEAVLIPADARGPVGWAWLFVFLTATLTMVRGAPGQYFYRTGILCEVPLNVSEVPGPGEEGWSGSRYCADDWTTIEISQKLNSYLFPLQLTIDFLVTPIFASLADRWSYVGVLLISVLATSVGCALAAVTASLLPDAAFDRGYEYPPPPPPLLPPMPPEPPYPPLLPPSLPLPPPPPEAPPGQTVEYTLLFNWGVLLLSKVALGVAGATVSGPSSGLMLSYVPKESRAYVMLLMLVARGLGSMVGNFVGLFGIVQQYLFDYTTAYQALAIVTPVTALPLLPLLRRARRSARAPGSPARSAVPGGSFSHKMREVSLERIELEQRKSSRLVKRPSSWWDSHSLPALLVAAIGSGRLSTLQRGH